MKLIAIDSSGLVATVAIATEDALIAEYTVNYKKTHSQTLLPMLDEIKKMTELDLATVDAIAIAAGPGSFTGLRIGCATAKGLGEALNKPVIGVPTIDALAYALFGAKGYVCPMMDARNNQVYTGVYDFNGGKMNVVKSQLPMDIYEIINYLNEAGRPVVFLGDGADAYRAVIEENVKTEFEFAVPHLKRQRASALGFLAVDYAKAGKVTDAADLRPDYMRLSQAERERMEK